MSAQKPDSGTTAPAFSGTFEALTDNGAVAQIYLNGTLVGETPYRSGKLPVGIYQVGILPNSTKESSGKKQVAEAVRTLVGADTTTDFPRLVNELERIALRQVVIKNGEHSQIVFGVGELIHIINSEKSSRTRIYLLGALTFVGVAAAVGFLVLN